jgi:uncharacterized protein YjcR
MSKFEQYGLAAEELYVRQNKTLAEIAAILQLSPMTILRWKKEGAWEETRKKFRASSRGALQVLEEVLNKKAEELGGMKLEAIDSKVIDGIMKLVASVRKLKEQDDIRVQALNVVGEMEKFLRKASYKENERQLFMKMISEFLTYLRDAN